MTDQKPKYAGKIIGGVIIAIVVILAWSLLKQSDQIIIDDNDNSINDQQNEKVDELVDNQNYNYTNPSEWDFYANATEDIQSLSKNQTIEYGVVRDPNEENYVYFASSTSALDDGAVLLSIYKYNEDNYTFDRIWRDTFINGETFDLTAVEDLAPVLRVAGYENGSLIVLAQYMDDSPGPCSSLYMMGTDDRSTRTLLTLDLSDPYSKFEEYEPTEEAIATAEAWVEQCKVEVGI